MIDTKNKDKREQTLKTQNTKVVATTSQQQYHRLTCITHIDRKGAGLQYRSRDMRFPIMWYVRPANAQTSLRVRAV